MKKITAATAVAALAVTLSACSEPTDEEKAVAQKAGDYEAFIPENNVEMENYNKAQELYDDPAAIQWCTAFPSSNSAPIITLPIAGKLTTSSTSYFAPSKLAGKYAESTAVPNRSVDGLFHGESYYRYGFTPAGQYVDFSNSLELLCTTALTEFQRENTYVEGVDTEANVDELQKRAEEALENGDAEGAVEILGGN